MRGLSGSQSGWGCSNGVKQVLQRRIPKAASTPRAQGALNRQLAGCQRLDQQHVQGSVHILHVCAIGTRRSGSATVQRLAHPP